jgi:hypothetical protein
MAARNPRVRKPPEKFIPSMQGNKYEIALAQITASLGKSKNVLVREYDRMEGVSAGINAP